MARDLLAHCHDVVLFSHAAGALCADGGHLHGTRIDRSSRGSDCAAAVQPAHHVSSSRFPYTPPCTIHTVSCNLFGYATYLTGRGVFYVYHSLEILAAANNFTRTSSWRGGSPTRYGPWNHRRARRGVQHQPPRLRSVLLACWLLQLSLSTPDVVYLEVDMPSILSQRVPAAQLVQPQLRVWTTCSIHACDALRVLLH
jgi:hypothetical protein